MYCIYKFTVKKAVGIHRGVEKNQPHNLFVVGLGKNGTRLTNDADKIIINEKIHS